MFRFYKLSETLVETTSTVKEKIELFEYILNDCNGFAFKHNHGFSKFSFVKHFANFKKNENGLFKIVNLKMCNRMVQNFMK